MIQRLKAWLFGKGFGFLIIIFSILSEGFGYENRVYLIGITLVMSYSIYQCFLPKKSCIYTLISKIPLNDIEMDYLRA